MALLTDTNYYSNAFAGRPQSANDVNVLETGVNPRFAVGFGFTRADGNKYRYVQYGDTILPGQSVTPITASNLVKDTDNKVLDSTTAIAVTGELLKPCTAGSRYVCFSAASITTHAFAGGYLIITDGPGIGYTYRIKNNTATESTNGSTRIELYEPLRATIGSTTDIAIRGSMYSDMALSDTTSNMRISSGISCAGGSAGKYGWICTKGVMGVRQASTLPSISGMGVVCSSTTAGAVVYANNYNMTSSGNFQIIGTYLNIGDSAGLSVSNLKIE